VGGVWESDSCVLERARVSIWVEVRDKRLKYDGPMFLRGTMKVTSARSRLPGPIVMSQFPEK